MESNCIVEYIPFLRTLSRRFCLNKDDQQDLVQNVLLRVLTSKSSFDTVNETVRRAWLSKAMYNAHIDSHRKIDLLATNVTGGGYIKDVEKVANQYTRADYFQIGPKFILATLKSAISSFPEEQQKVINDICLHGRNAETIADEQHCHVSAIYRILHRAKKAVTEHYAEEAMFEEERYT